MANDHCLGWEEPDPLTTSFKFSSPRLFLTFYLAILIVHILHKAHISLNKQFFLQLLERSWEAELTSTKTCQHTILHVIGANWRAVPFHHLRWRGGNKFNLYLSPKIVQNMDTKCTMHIFFQGANPLHPSRLRSTGVLYHMSGERRKTL